MATNLYLSMKKNNNVDLKAIQLMGGWKSVVMLEKYLKVDRLANAIGISSHSFFNWKAPITAGAFGFSLAG